MVVAGFVSLRHIVVPKTWNAESTGYEKIIKKARLFLTITEALSQQKNWLSARTVLCALALPVKGKKIYLDKALANKTSLQIEAAEPLPYQRAAFISTPVAKLPRTRLEIDPRTNERRLRVRPRRLYHNHSPIEQNPTQNRLLGIEPDRTPSWRP